MIKSNKGITLIALIVTIVVLLILVAVSINAVVGENGILKNVTTARVQTDIAKEKEIIGMAYSGLLDPNQKEDINIEDFQAEIIELYGNDNVSVVKSEDENEDEIFYEIKYLNSGRAYRINLSTGQIEDKINIEEILQTAQKPAEQVNTDNIGVSEDGTIVNLDLWEYAIVSQQAVSLVQLNSSLSETIGSGSTGSGTIGSGSTGSGTIGSGSTGSGTIGSGSTGSGTIGSGSTGSGIIGSGSEIVENNIHLKNYIGEFKNGEILGKVPMYIKIGEDIYTVTDMSKAFIIKHDLKIAPVIPSSVTNMNQTFASCVNLIVAPKIPSNVTNMSATFSHCSSLVVAPKIPNNVTNMNDTFFGCTSLTTAPVIPSSVIQMNYTFNRCSSLTGDLIINANPESYEWCLSESVTNQGCKLQLSGTSTILNEILLTASSSNVSIKSNGTIGSGS